MRQEKKKGQNKAAISLALCCAVVVLAGLFTVQSSIDKLNNANIGASDGGAGDGAQLGQPVNQQIPVVDSQSTNDDNGEHTPGGQAAKSGFDIPLAGEMILAYSADAPIYSKTLDQYMTHYGVDIAAPRDTQVKAAAAGTVTKVFTDDKNGITIELTHEGGYKTVYSNLSTTSMVETGDVVTQGQVISGVGDTSLFESLEEPHLHFEMLKDDVHVDPAAYMEF